MEVMSMPWKETSAMDQKVWIYVSQVLANEPIALQQIDDYLWEIRFGFFPIGMLNELKGTVLPL
jgi:hypothetical protein